MGRVAGLIVCTAFEGPSLNASAPVPCLATDVVFHVLDAIQGFEARFFVGCVQVLQMAQMDGMQNESSQPVPII